MGFSFSFLVGAIFAALLFSGTNINATAENSGLETLLAVGGIQWPGEFFMASLEEYNATEKSWSRIHYLPSELEYGQVSAVVDNKVYSCSTATAGGPCYRYDPVTNTWSDNSVTSLPQDFTPSNMVGLTDGKIYALGNPGDTTPLLVYDPAANSWTNAEDFPESNLGGVATEAGTDGKLYVAGGTKNNKSMSSLYAYDPAQKEWTQLADLPTPRTELALASFTHKANGTHWLAAIGGSSTAGELNVVDLFDIAGNRWVSSKGYKLHTARQSAGATAAADGYLYVVGGVQEGLGLKSCEKVKISKLFDTKLDGKTKIWEKFPKGLSKARASFSLFTVKV